MYKILTLRTAIYIYIYGRIVSKKFLLKGIVYA